MGKLVNADTGLSLHAAAAASGLALCAAIGLGEDGAAPEWVHVLPAGTIFTNDGRGPYRITDVPAFLATSLQQGERLVLDENHSTDLAAPAGRPAPAMGWMVELQARDNGIWARVEWTEAGQRAVAGRAYRGISPVIEHDKSGRVVALRRASLVNQPNIKNLQSLHQETDVNPLLTKLLAALGLPTETSEDTLVAAVTTMHHAQAGHATALQAQLGPIAKAAGLGETATAAEVITAIGTLTTAPDAKSIVALQAEISQLTTSLNAERDTRKRRDAEAFIDGAIKAGKTNVRPLRDHYITRHMADPAAVEKEIGAFPSLGLSSARTDPPASRDAAGKRVLTAEQETTIKLMSLDRDAYIATLEAQDTAETAV